MVHRALAVCSTYTLLATEFNGIREIARKNGYPLSFIDNRIDIGLSNFFKKVNEFSYGSYWVREKANVRGNTLCWNPHLFIKKKIIGYIQ